MEAIMFETNIRCKRCGNRLVFMEDEEYVGLVCNTCGAFALAPVHRIARAVFNYPERRFNARFLFKLLRRMHEEAAAQMP